MSSVSPKTRTEVRRAITSAAFTMALLVAMVGLFSLFSVWSINRAWLSGTAEASRLQDLSRTAVESQVSFKVQVQEWKNILLRGDNPEMLERYRTAFGAKAAEVQGHLRRVSSIAAEMHDADSERQAQSLLQVHEAVTKRYEEVLADALRTSPKISAESARAMDKNIRGIDRELEQQIGFLSVALTALSTQRYQTIAGEMGERYESLRRFIIGVIVASLVITALTLTRALRATKE